MKASAEQPCDLLNAEHFCFHCGYRLSGLQLPRNCPECGQFADPPAQAQRAATWFATRGALTWFLHPRLVPPGVMYVLRNASHHRVARRRAVLLLWVPAMASLLIVLVAQLFSLEMSVIARYYDQSKPNAPLIHINKFTRVEEPFGLNLHLFEEGFFRKPASWKRVEEIQTRRLRFGIEPKPDGVTWSTALGPLLVLVFGFYLIGWLMRVWRPLRRQDALPIPRRSVTAAWSLMVPLYAAGMWAWLAAVVTRAASFAYWPAWFSWVSLILCMLALSFWLVASLIAPVAFSRLDKGKLVLSGSNALVPLGMVVAVGAPVLAWYGLSRLAW